MKSSYELAMERLAKAAPTVKLTAAQKAAIAELESVAKAKQAQLELSSRDEVAAALGAGDAEKADELRRHAVIERKKIETTLDEKKAAVRGGSK
jgi:Spy/CpxP family protein refolding chaperone